MKNCVHGDWGLLLSQHSITAIHNNGVKSHFWMDHDRIEAASPCWIRVSFLSPKHNRNLRRKMGRISHMEGRHTKSSCGVKLCSPETKPECCRGTEETSTYPVSKHGWFWAWSTRNTETVQQHHLNLFCGKPLFHERIPNNIQCSQRKIAISLWLASRVVSPSFARFRCVEHSECLLPSQVAGDQNGWALFLLSEHFVPNSWLCWVKQWNRMKICLHFLHGLTSISNVIKTVLRFWPIPITHLW